MDVQIGGFTAAAIAGFTLLAFALLVFMALVQPVWCIVDVALDSRRRPGSKALWIVVLVLLYGLANWFYGAFAAAGLWLRRLTRIAWLVMIVAAIGFFALYLSHEEFRYEMQREWRSTRPLTVMLPALLIVPAT
jgi:hypothetical protein